MVLYQIPCLIPCNLCLSCFWVAPISWEETYPAFWCREKGTSYVSCCERMTAPLLYCERRTVPVPYCEREISPVVLVPPCHMGGHVWCHVPLSRNNSSHLHVGRHDGCRVPLSSIPPWMGRHDGFRVPGGSPHPCVDRHFGCHVP